MSVWELLYPNGLKRLSERVGIWEMTVFQITFPVLGLRAIK
ncbi:hypothetical protein ES705_33559 [subsurface metagenome]